VNSSKIDFSIPARISLVVTDDHGLYYNEIRPASQNKFLSKAFSAFILKRVHLYSVGYLSSVFVMRQPYWIILPLSMPGARLLSYVRQEKERKT
jgi:hypothetical protein